jgi:hypothetical protein
MLDETDGDDDGVTTRLGEHHYHMTTTSSGAVRVLAWMESAANGRTWCSHLGHRAMGDHRMLTECSSLCELARTCRGPGASPS